MPNGRSFGQGFGTYRGPYKRQDDALDNRYNPRFPKIRLPPVTIGPPIVHACRLDLRKVRDNSRRGYHCD